MRLRNRIAGELAAPVLIVALRAGDVELALATFVRGAPALQKGLQFRVDGNFNGHAA